MTCCCPHSQSASRFFSFFARRYRKRFLKYGLEASQQQLVQGLERAGFKDNTLLEIGSGVGYLHQYLLAHGAATAVGIDLSPDMLQEAEKLAKTKQLADRVHYIHGDVMELADEVIDVDISILDKVVCCYPDAKGMVGLSVTKSKRAYALTYPRYRGFIRLTVAISAVVLKLLGSDFRPYVHNPADIENWVTEAGFKKIYQAKTFIWLTQVYQKSH